MGKIFSSLTETEKAYIAGFLDGDGSIIAPIEPHKEKKFGYRIRVIIKFSQYTGNITVLKFLKRKIGVGYISTNKGKETSEYVIKTQSEVLKLLKLLLPYVLLKRRQTQLAISLLDKPLLTKEEIVRAAELANKISLLNLKTKSRRKHTLQEFLESISRND